ncbi:hypothetical protein HOY80DRAFT_1015685 [Tuber brumale]|nr:hypothetical protein HOY80DRAFT_1015685 [Tuber brumale]
MPLNRAVPRNVSFYDATHTNVALGGFLQNGSITEANFLDILGIILVVDGYPLRVQGRISGHTVCRTDVSLQPGVYDIYCDASIKVNDEPWIQRLVSHKISTQPESFHHEIRNRDRKCVISGISVPEIHIQAQNWIPFVATHIFPSEHESIDDASRSSGVNSPQNGFLLETTIEQLFNQYLITINPDDGYKVVVFDVDIFGYDGRILDPVCRNQDDPHRVSDDALRWHFRQSVLANVRGVGEPIFEHDFPPGTDMLSEILSGPCAQERFELEIATRLRGVA